jgi:hypothetical protein
VRAVGARLRQFRVQRRWLPAAALGRPGGSTMRRPQYGRCLAAWRRGPHLPAALALASRPKGAVRRRRQCRASADAMRLGAWRFPRLGNGLHALASPLSKREASSREVVFRRACRRHSNQSRLIKRPLHVPSCTRQGRRAAFPSLGNAFHSRRAWLSCPGMGTIHIGQAGFADYVVRSPAVLAWMFPSLGNRLRPARNASRRIFRASRLGSNYLRQ